MEGGESQLLRVSIESVILSLKRWGKRHIKMAKGGK